MLTKCLLIVEGSYRKAQVMILNHKPTQAHVTSLKHKTTQALKKKKKKKRMRQGQLKAQEKKRMIQAQMKSMEKKKRMRRRDIMLTLPKPEEEKEPSQHLQLHSSP